MKIKKIITLTGLVLISLIPIGCSESKNTEINILATTDLHGAVPYNMAEYIKKEREEDRNLTLVDAGDFMDSDGGGAMDKYSKERVKENPNIRMGTVDYEDKYVEFPLAKDMKEVGYDAVVLGNHEFISNNRFHLDNMISDFEKNNIDVLSANTYKDNNENYTKPYSIKEIDTDDGTVKLGILGLTIKEIGEGKTLDENGNLVKVKSRELKDQEGYDGKLYMNDLVEEAKKWVKVIEEKEEADIIVAVVHSGEKPKKPRNPGNRIQELAQEVDGIDAIVAGHTHKAFEQHDYKNKSGETVIVTQSGKHGEGISKITFELKKDKGEWKVEDKYAKLIKFEKDKSEDYAGEVIYNISCIKAGVEEVNLKDLTPFEWDKAYVFDTNTPVDKIYEKVGYKWRSIVEKEKDSELQIVFMKDEKAVCYLVGDTDMMGISINFDKKIYKNGVIEIEPNKNDKFSVEKGKDVFETNLIYIEN